MQIEQIHDLEFDDLIKAATDVDDRTRALWLEIYKNAIDDRERVSILYTNLQSELNSAQGHVVYGMLITKYLEKMAKSNDQLLKLAEQCLAYKKSDGSFSADDLLDKMGDE
jgi:hypothetical protein